MPALRRAFVTLMETKTQIPVVIKIAVLIILRNICGSKCIAKSTEPDSFVFFERLGYTRGVKRYRNKNVTRYLFVCMYVD